ncbi:LPXTG cell wall anchor domain-containing protein [Microbacterium sp. Se5.02b]|nr:LPXTG cell wall anchor domain-containing protein [Microbacterium sp. Se5.02b]QYM63383.1 LPXTG cell wall anchor domain-containing protein [Microbacterium sp. Se5.02b]
MLPTLAVFAGLLLLAGGGVLLRRRLPRRSEDVA